MMTVLLEFIQKWKPLSRNSFKEIVYYNKSFQRSKCRNWSIQYRLTFKRISFKLYSHLTFVSKTTLFLLFVNPVSNLYPKFHTTSFPSRLANYFPHLPHYEGIHNLQQKLELLMFITIWLRRSRRWRKLK